jgi:hypothetical protein
MKNIENLILDFKNSRSDETFNEIYEFVTKAITGAKDGNPYLRTVAKSMNVDFHSTKALFDDTLLKAISNFVPGTDFIRYFKSGFRRNRAQLYRDKKRIRSKEMFDEHGKEGLSLFDTITDLHNVEDTVISKKKADQRKLIDSLLEGADADTTAIVNAFLTHPKPTATAIAKDLGIHHSKVLRNFEKLGGHFNYKQFGDYRDYLLAL